MAPASRVKNSAPGDDLLSALVAPGDVCDRLSDSELQNIVFTLLLAAYVPPANAMAVAVLQLFRHPDQHAVLRANPALIGTAVDELLRIDQSSAADQLRVATADVDIGGVPFRAGEIVVAPLRCANQDPAVFVDADRFDVTSAENPHLTFAYGPHYCLGAALARLQLQVGIGVLVGRLPQLRLAVPFAELSWTPMFFTLNGPQTLPVVW
ncbi:MAG: cytochrome P450 [Candidatus Dormibacteraeota bacterium]|uniref:Cytochrome P450 n=1 Tax=Candidatus Aeolococcus gillhamiae TaxID=3127015 RepID=A0A934K3E0_9BACT|nr:cytochrome P450 [Candidatus Dormibacteraeota bacterium]